MFDMQPTEREATKTTEPECAFVSIYTSKSPYLTLNTHKEYTDSSYRKQNILAVSSRQI